MEELCKQPQPPPPPPPPPPSCVSIEEPPLPNGKGGGAAVVHLIAKLPEEELLGSVTMHNCPGTRASARVIQKMKQDLTRPMTPPPSEREPNKKDEKTAQKTPSQLKTGSGKTTWTNVERNCFFDALNEFGKDFEAVANCINAKLKRRNGNSDYSFKTKDQVRQHYYQTYHKICKYVRFSDELKKPAQELYTLINYGEMRRKLQFLTEKHFMKLKQLVYQGQITVRCKGKNIRIKTPSCKALRRLNQLDDSLEDIRLPSKVEVLVTPANMEAFGRVQSLAQNPRGRIIVPLHKKLISFIKTFEYKWRSANQRLHEEKSAYFPSSLATSTTSNNNNNNNNETEPLQPAVSSLDPSMCFQPRPGVAIHRPLLSITAYLSSINICLTAYEERMGFKVRSETLGNLAGISVAASKRPRTESGSEKRSPETKKPKSGASPPLEKSLDDGPLLEGNLMKMENSSGDELGEEIHEFLGDILEAPPHPQTATIPAISAISALPIPSDTTTVAVALEASADPVLQTDPATADLCHPLATTVLQASCAGAPAPSTPVSGSSSAAPPVARSKRKEAKEAAAAAQARNFKPLLSDDILKRIRKGWTQANAADITIGDLYVVFGQDSKLELEYYWCEVDSATAMAPSILAINTVMPSSASVATQTGTSSSINATTATNASSNCSVSNASTTLPYNPNDCDSVERVKAVTTSSVSNKLKHLLLVANLSERVRKRQCNCGHTCDRKRDLMTKAQQLAEATAATGGISLPEGNFRTPMLPVRRPISNIDPVRQLSALTRQKISRQVLVQRRLLPPTSIGGRPYDLLSVRQLHSGLFEPIDRLDGTSSSSSGISSSGSKPDSSMGATLASQDQRPEDLRALEFLNDEATQASARDMPNLDICVATSTTGVSSSLAETVQDESTSQNFFHGSVSPMHLLRDSTSNARWLEDNINDFSLTSLLGHLDGIDATRDILDPSSSMSVISESSVDFRHKFQEIAALLQQQEKD
ncbi:protein cramped [Drosophila teissieri]|uniref:protein cramped n=1 Tax=Drosophila teissieri TaxID=7243 RepID=UPI001CBA3D43|nr:protein cramped [Drosophila teissieri]